MMHDIVLSHLNKYPLMTTQDVIKLIYQTALGNGHIANGGMAGAEYIAKEMASAEGFGESVIDGIDNGMARVHLRPLSDMFTDDPFASRMLAGLFKDGSKHSCEKSRLVCALRSIPKAYEGSTFAILSEFGEAIEKYISDGCPVLRHSQVYRDAYRPAYRVLPASYAQYIELFGIAHSRNREGKRTVIAIDGRCGCGKSALARLLGAAFGCGIVSMDDFFLPAELRTEQRLDEPGGNTHYERFASEVINPLLSGGDIEHRVFDCSIMDYASRKKRIKSGSVLIIEGTYCMRPEFRRAYDISVFITADSKTQSARLLRREGGEGGARFRDVWIPLEEKYFAQTGTQDACSLTFATDKR